MRENLKFLVFFALKHTQHSRDGEKLRKIPRISSEDSSIYPNSTVQMDGIVYIIGTVKLREIECGGPGKEI